MLCRLSPRTYPPAFQMSMPREVSYSPSVRTGSRRADFPLKWLVPCHSHWRSCTGCCKRLIAAISERTSETFASSLALHAAMSTGNVKRNTISCDLKG